MSVLIKGFPLPNNCGACPLRLAWCRERIYMVTRPERCPLVPVPPHGRLGDLDELERDFREDAKGPWNMRAMPMNWADAFEEVADIVADAPTIIEAEETLKEATNDQNNS